MAILGTAYEANDSLEMEETRDGLVFNRNYNVISNDVADDGIVILSATGLPLVGNGYVGITTSFPMARCVSRVPTRITPGTPYWNVKCRFETPKPESGGDSPTNSQQLPQLEIPEIKFGFSEMQVPALITAFGDPNPEPFVNSAGEMFDPSPTMTVYMPTLEISRNEIIANPLPQVAVQYCGTINSDAWWGALPRQVMCKGITIQRMTKVLNSGYQIVYLRASYNFAFLYPDFDLRILDAGTYWNDSPFAQKRHAFIDQQGHPKTGLLDGSTGMRAGGANLDNANLPAAYIKKKVYRALPFAALLLPQSFIG